MIPACFVVDVVVGCVLPDLMACVSVCVCVCRLLDDSGCCYYGGPGSICPSRFPLVPHIDRTLAEGRRPKRAVGHDSLMGIAVGKVCTRARVYVSCVCVAYACACVSTCASACSCVDVCDLKSMWAVMQALLLLLLIFHKFFGRPPARSAS